MQTFKVTNEAEKTSLVTAAEALKAANAQIAAANKIVESSKAAIVKWLADNRGVVLDTLAIGDIVNIDGVCMVERAKQNKFDEKAFALAQPATHTQYKRDFPMNKFKPLV